MALGTTYLLEWLPSPAIIELDALSDGQWLLDGIWAPRNTKTEPEVVWAIRRKLRKHGVLLPRQHNDAAAPQMRVAKLLGVYDFRFGSQELDDLVDSVAAA